MLEISVYDVMEERGALGLGDDVLIQMLSIIVCMGLGEECRKFWFSSDHLYCHLSVGGLIINITSLILAL